MLATAAGLLAATGGALALAGRDLYGLTVMERVALLNPMYDAGEIVFGWQTAARGEVVNVVLERLTLDTPRGPKPCWRAEIYVEEPEGHMLRGALVQTEFEALGAGLARAIADSLAEVLPPAGFALARLARC